MASLINRLTKSKSPPRLLASLNAALAPKSGPLSPNPNLVSSQTLIPCDSKFETSSRSSEIIFPSFPFGYCLNPSLYPPMRLPETRESESEDSSTVWADSTKLKRKKKMNKHKHQKRMKLLRRKSRSK